jgi:hypothetical protein
VTPPPTTRQLDLLRRLNDGAVVAELRAVRPSLVLEPRPDPPFTVNAATFAGLKMRGYVERDRAGRWRIADRGRHALAEAARW